MENPVMLLCDIGNTSYHFLDDDADYKESAERFDPSSVEKTVYYISVKSSLSEKLASLANWIDIAQYVEMKEYYPTMGVDRIFACEAVENGVIVDAGSAVTVDVVREGVFVGGFIYPGVEAMQGAYKSISPALEYELDFDVALDTLPKNSQDALSYAYFKLLQREVLSHNMPILLTGGYAQAFTKLFKEAQVDERLIFRGMQKVLQKSNSPLHHSPS